MDVKTINIGTPFNTFYTYLGYLFLLGSFILFYLLMFEEIIEDEYDSKIYLSIVIFLFLFSILLSFTTNKIRLDNKKKIVFVYFQVLLFKFGIKSKSAKFKSISILSKRMKSSSSVVSGFSPTSHARSEWNISVESSYSLIKHEVVLLDSSHRKKLLLNRFDTFEEAKEFADMIADYIKKPLVKYNPKRISKRKKQSP